MQILIDYPWIFGLGCLLLGAAYAAILYWAKGQSLSKRLSWILAILRTLSVALTAFLLLSPMVKRTINETERPIILLAQDRSESVLASTSGLPTSMLADSSAISSLTADLEKDYDVYTFDYGGKSTDMSEIMSVLKDQYGHRNVGAMILTGDGIWNSGSNPSAQAVGSPYPIYTIALGDTSQRRDAAIADIRYGRIAYMGNRFPVEVTVKASLLAGARKRLTVSKEGRQIFSKEISYTSSNFSVTESLELEADKAGVQCYTVKIEASDNETTLKNNERTFAIEVIDGHQKIAIIAATPHPDISALKQAISENANYEAESFLGRDFRSNPKDYSLIILHQIPSRSGIRLDIGETPCVYILGGQSDIAQFNALHTGLEIITRLTKQSDAAAIYNESFAPFSLEESTAKSLEEMPPLSMPFGDYHMGPGMQGLLNGRIGTVDSKMPLICVGQQGGIRRTIVAGEGLWRWRMADFQANGSHEHFNELVNKIVVYTSMRADRERFRLVAKSNYRQDENIAIEAELYDDNYELVNTPEAHLRIESKDYALNRSGNRYTLNLGQMEPGTYSCSATTRLGGKDFNASCNFVVEEMNLEEADMTADHALMQAIAQQSGGQMVLPSDISKLPAMLRESHIKPVIYSHTSYTEMLNLWWILALIIVLLGIEWVARKYNGEI